ncbi:MAG: ATP-binding protein [Sphingomonadales bacterium]|nr:ATP-binding protein [Sphingomonadales bacterium]
MKFEATLQTLTQGTALIDQIISDLGHMYELSTECETKIRLALGESVRNALQHGNLFDPSKDVVIRCYAECNVFHCEVVDQGEGFDESDVPDPTAESRLAQEGGRGVLLTRWVSDHFEYRREERTAAFSINLKS